MFIEQTLESDNDLLSVIQKGLKSDKKWVSQDGRMYASTSGFCSRQTALSMTYSGFQEDSAETTEFFKLGIAIEDLNIQALRKMGKLLFSQYELPDVGLNLGGKIDGIYCLDEQHIRLLEVKSCGDLPDKPHAEHLAQASIYSAITGLPITLLYSSRNVYDFRSNELLQRKFEIEWNSLQLNESLVNAIYGKYSAESGYMPDKPASLNKEYKCGFCRFKGICWHDEIPHLKPLDYDDYEIYEKALNKSTELLDPDNVISRRNGVLKHLATYGSSYAQDLLSRIEWKDIV